MAALCKRARTAVMWCLVRVVEVVGAPLPPRSCSMEADAIRPGIIRETSGKNGPRRARVRAAVR